MRKILLNVSIGMVGLLVFQACLDEVNRGYTAYGVIQNVQSDGKYEILTDKGNKLVAVKSRTTQEIADGKRVFANFDLLSDKEKSKNIYDVEVWGFYHLLSKPLVAESFILENETHRRDSIGNDPFNGIYTWLGGGYLNINFEAYFSQYSNTKHFINLVYDDTRADADTIYLTLRHNAYGETPAKMYELYRGLGRCSFKIIDLQRYDNSTGRPYKLTWSQYANHDYDSKEHSIVFKLDEPVVAASAGFEEKASQSTYDSQINMQ